MKSDIEIRRRLAVVVRWDPVFETQHLHASVAEGVITLKGVVAEIDQKFAAERAVLRVEGVLGVNNEIAPALPSSNHRTDLVIARDVRAALITQMQASGEHVRVQVRHGWITLQGRVEWHHQKETAEHTARRVRGAQGLINMLEVKPFITPQAIKRQIDKALHAPGKDDARDITVATGDDGVVILKGCVHSSTARKQVEKATWSTTGVRQVEDRITVNRH